MSRLTPHDYDEMLRLEEEARASRNNKAPEGTDVFDLCKNCPTPTLHRGGGFCSDKCKAEFAEVERRYNKTRREQGWR